MFVEEVARNTKHCYQVTEYNRKRVMENTKIQQLLTQKFEDKIYGFQEHFGVLKVYADKNINLKLMQFLYDHEELAFRFLTDLTAVHYPKHKGGEIEVTYLMYNMYTNLSIRLNFAIDIKQPDIFTATKLFEAANWLERECYDFFGVNFIGHPNLIRIMNVEEMDYFPLRKEFPLEDQTRKDKDDEMFGRGNNFNYGSMNIKG